MSQSTGCACALKHNGPCESPYSGFRGWLPRDSGEESFRVDRFFGVDRTLPSPRLTGPSKPIAWHRRWRLVLADMLRNLAWRVER